MKVFLAGAENLPFLRVATISGIKQVLFSYFHIQKQGKNTATLFSEMNENDLEVICDSGLFTMMFGAGKGKSYDLNFMIDYTKKYIAEAKSWGVKKLTIVEADVHKILGLEAVFELRKYFEDSGLNVLYVWHKEEGIPGLIQMAQNYEYISISVPELRILFKGRGERYQAAVYDLLNLVRQNNQFMPKIHLLGNTVQETMETRLAYSCDSTSWIAGGKYGRGIIFKDGKLKACGVREPAYIEYVKVLMDTFTDRQKSIYDLFQKDSTRKYMTINMISGFSFKLYQDYLNKKFPWVGLEERVHNENQRQFADFTYR